LTEDDLIRSFQAQARRLGIASGNGVVQGIGDDCAIFRPPGGRSDLVFTTDMMHEGVHFRLGESARAVGHKALTRSLSDCAAMGARPLFCTLSLAFPKEAERWAKDFYNGFSRLASVHSVIIAGGDLASTERICCDVAVCGQVPRGKAMLRSAAVAGDTIYVSGTLGKAALALESGRRFVPQARVQLGEQLRDAGVRCAMDLSDGVSSDLARLCKASGLAANLTDVPIARGATLAQALHGGEDYELLFTVPHSRGVPKGCHAIGHIMEGRAGLVLFRGEPLAPQGWDHFRSQ
jgi:thiamine-monophosphate kinase